jgi:soluble lytic murein transglycosylase-like protein
LNNRSFPQLEEEDFFNPAVSAKYGMSHLRFCLNVAGNEVTGLAMYNAGTNKVRSGRTPESTLNYVGKIKAYQDKLEKLFAEEVLAYYETSQPMSGISVAFFK